MHKKLSHVIYFALATNYFNVFYVDNGFTRTEKIGSVDFGGASDFSNLLAPWASGSRSLMLRAALHIDNNIDMFADDSTLHTSGHKADEIQHSLRTNLNAVTTWCEDSRMIINTQSLLKQNYHQAAPILSAKQSIGDYTERSATAAS